MRGKHGVAAEKRRTVAELEERANSAEHRAAKAEAALAELKETSGRQINGLRAELTQAVKERDATTSPQLEASQRHIRELIRTQTGLQIDLARHDKSRTAYQRFTVAFLVDTLLAAGIEEAALASIKAEFRRKLRAAAAEERQSGMAERTIEATRLAPAFGETHMPEVVQ